MYEQGYRPPRPKDCSRNAAQHRASPPRRSSGRYAAPYAPVPQYAPQSQQPPAAPYATACYSQSVAHGPDRRQQGYTPPKSIKAVQRRSTNQGAASGGKPTRKKSGMGRFLMLLVLLAVLGAGGYCGKTYLDVHPYDDVFCNNVYVDGIHLGGLTAQAGYNAVQAQAQDRQNSWYVRLMYGEQTVATITADLLGMQTQTQQVLAQAWQPGHTGSLFDRKRAMDQLMAQPYEAYTAIPDANTQVIDDMLTAIKNDLYRAPVDAKMIGFDPLASEPFSYQSEVAGRTLDTEPLKEALYRMVSKMESGDLQVEPTMIEPAVTAAQLQSHYALLSDVTTQIDKHSSDNRNNNIRRACELISGTVLKAGDKFSFNSAVGPRTYKNGFYDAIEYAYGQEVMGVGGGVCQVSSTLYLAALKAGLTIINREPHSKEVSYTVYGQDATVSYEGKKIDFVFRNTSAGNIYIVASVQNSTANKNRYICRVRIYGETLGEDTFYDVESVTTQVIKPSDEIIYDKDKTGEYVKYTDQTKKKSSAHEGYVVETYRSKVAGGVEVERELISIDTYKARQARYWVGVTER